MKTTPPFVPKTRPARAAFLVCSGVALLFAGCATEPESHVVSAPPPAGAPLASSSPVVVQTPVVGQASSGSASPASTQAVVVTQAPPALQSEPVLEQPTTRHVWIPGYWTYRDNRYVWIAGRWELPPTPDARWSAPRWEREGSGYRFYEGYWD